MIARLAYAAAFTIALPLLLILWSAALARTLPDLPIAHSPAIGWSLFALATALIAASMLSLRIKGGGLPMNAFPPPRLVTTGPYRLTSHPIYAGFVLACAGASIALGSPAGLWIVTPIATLGCAALVLGYERHDLRRRFGPDLPRPLLRLPPNDDRRPAAPDRLSVYFLIFLPWLIAYETLGHLTSPAGIPLHLPIERSWPVLEWTEWVYASVYPIVLLVPLVARRSADLRRFCIAALVAIVLGHVTYFVLPLTAPARPFEPSSLAGRLLLLERADGLDGRAAFPSFHVIWAILAAWLIARSFPRWAVAAWLWCAALLASCLTTGMHALADLPAGALLALASLNAHRIWQGALALAERTANSWRDWRVGPIRIISHGAYAGLGALIGVAGAGLLLGPDHAPAVAFVSLCALIGAGLWGQILVGSRTLLRPFGYYGSILGATVGLGAGALAGGNPWLIAAALAVAAPLVQAVGRLRCLVQGCCHGAPASPTSGIRYRHPLSRVCRIAHLDNVPIHPTPLYSIAANLLIAPILLRLWFLAVPASFLIGLYLILAGLARFVEEAHRGEPQTPIRAGLRLYQWLAAASVCLGGFLAIIPSPAIPAGIQPSALAIALGLGAAFLYGVAMGVDLPGSNRRFSRLA